MAVLVETSKIKVNMEKLTKRLNEAYGESPIPGIQERAWLRWKERETLEVWALLCHNQRFVYLQPMSPLKKKLASCHNSRRVGHRLSLIQPYGLVTHGMHWTYDSLLSSYNTMVMNKIQRIVTYRWFKVGVSSKFLVGSLLVPCSSTLEPSNADYVNVVAAQKAPPNPPGSYSHNNRTT